MLSVTTLLAITNGVWVICSLILNKHWQILYTKQITTMSTSSEQHALVSNKHNHKQRKSRQSMEKIISFSSPLHHSYLYLLPSYILYTFSSLFQSIRRSVITSIKESLHQTRTRRFRWWRHHSNQFPKESYFLPFKYLQFLLPCKLPTCIPQIGITPVSVCQYQSTSQRLSVAEHQSVSVSSRAPVSVCQ